VNAATGDRRADDIGHQTLPVAESAMCFVTPLMEAVDVAPLR
jgi:hypothetical protein